MPAHPPFIPALDGIRAFAVMAVVVYHRRVCFDNTWFAPISHCGWVGVDVFFVLSGFLITRNLFSTKARSNYFSSFYLKRMLRIQPLYLILVVCAFLGYAISNRPSPDPWWPYLVMIQGTFFLFRFALPC
jgi:peptidoglycan/LPS O-acetylase OafA/YrhL